MTMTGAPFKTGDMAERVARFPRVALIHRPTPLRKLERLSAALGGPEIWIKRDDLTGFAFGGNKSRKLEFIIPDAMAQHASVLITWGGLQSNWAMQTAAACRMFGIRPVLILFKTRAAAAEDEGNVLLDRHPRSGHPDPRGGAGKERPGCGGPGDGRGGGGRNAGAGSSAFISCPSAAPCPSGP